MRHDEDKAELKRLQGGRRKDLKKAPDHLSGLQVFM